MSTDVPMMNISEIDVSASDGSSRQSIKRSRPFCQRMLRNVNVFVFFLCLYALVYGSLVPYMISMITNIEKRFNVPSSVSGIIIGATEIGYLISVLPISHYGVRSHIPRVLGVCGLLISFSAFMWAMPYFIYGPLSVSVVSTLTSNKSAELCHSAKSMNTSSAYQFTESPISHKTSQEINIHLVLFFLIFGAILNGVGSTPFFNIGVTFVDSNVSKVKSSSYFGLLFCVRTIAPVIGFLFGGALASFPENIHAETSLPPTDPRFIGAWWLGFIILGVVTGVTAIPLLFFSKEMDKQVDESSTDEESDFSETIKPKEEDLAKKRFSVFNKSVESIRKTRKDAIINFLKALKRMLTNPAVVLMTVGAAIDYVTFSSFGTFLPKYFEVQFERTAASASISVGAVAALAAALGSLIGGYLMTRFPSSLVKQVLHSSIVLTIMAALGISFIFLSCPQIPVSGSIGSSGQWNASLECNSRCICDLNQFQPICSTDNQVFLSPCAAGCKEINSMKFSSCNCFANSTITGTPGLCKYGCDVGYIAFVVISFVIGFISNMAYMPFAMASLRCVHEKDKSLAMALLSFLSSLLGIGGSPLYGMIIDNACLLKGDSGYGACLLYDRSKLRFLFIGTSLLSHIPSVIMFFLTYIALKRNLYMQENEAVIKREADKKRGKHSIKT